MSLFSNINFKSNSISDSASLASDYKKRKEIDLSACTIGDGKGNTAEFVSYSEAKKAIAASKPNKEYPPLFGTPEFVSSVTSLLYPNSSTAIKENRFLICQNITGGASTRTAADVLRATFPNQAVYIPDVSNSSLPFIFQKNTYLTYPLATNGTSNVTGFTDFLGSKTEVPVLIPVGGNNPTGISPSKTEWDAILSVAKKNNIFLIFDISYLGFSSGDFYGDLYPLYKAESMSLEFFFSYSLSANFSMSADHTGVFGAVLNCSKSTAALKTHLIRMNRAYVSFPSQFPGRVVSTVLSNKSIRSSWEQDMANVSELISARREQLLKALDKYNAPISSLYARVQSGPFFFFSLSDEQWSELGKRFGVFLFKGGRLNLTRLVEEDIDFVASSIAKVLKHSYKIKY